MISCQEVFQINFQKQKPPIKISGWYSLNVIL